MSFRHLTRSVQDKMAARILSRLNWVSRRFYTATADSSKMTLAEKEAAESKHAECKFQMC